VVVAGAGASVVVVAGAGASVVVVAGAGASVVVVAGASARVVVVAGSGVVDDVLVEEVLVLLDVVVLESAHSAFVMTLESKVTAPFRANSRPSTLASVFAVIEVKARMVPTNVEFTPSVAELPTCQKTLQAWAPLVSITVLLSAVTRVDPAWKMKTASGSPSASRVSVPVMANDGEL
jgi:hypothetical protein